MLNRAGLLQVVKQEFRHWYGLLSFEEILSNRKLVDLIGAIEGHQEFKRTGRVQ